MSGCFHGFFRSVGLNWKSTGKQTTKASEENEKLMPDTKWNDTSPGSKTLATEKDNAFNYMQRDADLGNTSGSAVVQTH